tara:strand:+ start:187 stop:1083 length:897 start_codon:yes stop_codon:yes gene_type:complete
MKTIVTKEKYNGWLCRFKNSKIKLWRFIIDSKAEVIKQTMSRWGVSEKTANEYYAKYIPDLIALLATDKEEREQYIQEHYFACNRAKYEAHLLKQKRIEKGLKVDYQKDEKPSVKKYNKWSNEELEQLKLLYEVYKDERGWPKKAAKVLNEAFHEGLEIRTASKVYSRYNLMLMKEEKLAQKSDLPKVNKGAKRENDEIILDATKEAKVMSFNDTQKSISVMCDRIKTMLLAKNKQYGDSVMSPIRVFSKADKTEQLKVRIDDKINRLLQGDESIESDVDVIDDLIGYLILLRISMEE